MRKQPKLKASRMLCHVRQQSVKSKRNTPKYTTKMQHEISSTRFITTYRQKHYDLVERIEQLGKTSHGDITVVQKHYNLVEYMEIYSFKEKETLIIIKVTAGKHKPNSLE